MHVLIGNGTIENLCIIVNWKVSGIGFQVLEYKKIYIKNVKPIILYAMH